MQLEIIAIVAGAVHDSKILNHIHEGLLGQKWTEAMGRSYCEEKMQFLMEKAQNELSPYQDFHVERE